MDKITSPVVDGMVSIPAFIANNPQAGKLDLTPNANLEVFSKPVEGNVDTGVTHQGDLGRGMSGK